MSYLTERQERMRQQGGEYGSYIIAAPSAQTRTIPLHSTSRTRLFDSPRQLSDLSRTFPTMGFRFRRSIRLLPGLRLNLGKRGVSVSAGVRGAHVTIGKDGTRTTVGIPGTGVSYTDFQRYGANPDSAPAPADQPAQGGVSVLLLAIFVVVVFVWLMN